MEGPGGKFEPNPDNRFKDTKLFGEFLSKARNALSKNRAYIVSVLHTSKAIPFNWEEGVIFPEEDKLPAIAEAYQVSLEELTKVYKISKVAREEEKAHRKELKSPLRKKIYRDTEIFWGNAGPAKSGKKQKS